MNAIEYAQTFSGASNFSRIGIERSLPYDYLGGVNNDQLSILTYNSEEEKLQQGPYGDFLNQANSDLISVVTTSHSMPPETTTIPNQSQLINGMDDAHDSVIHVAQRDWHFYLQRRTTEWRHWYDTERIIESRVAEDMRGSVDSTEEAILFRLKQAYYTLLVHQMAPHAKECVPVLQQYDEQRYGAIEQGFQVILSQGQLQAWDQDFWESELAARENIDDKRTCLISTIGALAISQTITHRHFTHPINVIISVVFADLLRKCRSLERLCLLNVGHNLFLDPPSSPPNPWIVPDSGFHDGGNSDED